jgi:prevent-host-death family protein
MRTVNATEAARNFAAVLDGVEHRGQTYVVARGGKPVARITPVPTTDGRGVKRLLREHQPDADWLGEIAALRADLPEDYDLEVARSHALLLTHARRSGRVRGAHDLLIAAPRSPESGLS